MPPLPLTRFPSSTAALCTTWATKLGVPLSSALDVGCATGRTSFDLSRDFDMVVGVDFSHAFVAAANALRASGRAEYTCTREGETSERHVALVPAGVRSERCAFQQGDACALPSAKALGGPFSVIHGANLLCRLPDPMCVGVVLVVVVVAVWGLGIGERCAAGLFCAVLERVAFFLLLARLPANSGPAFFDPLDLPPHPTHTPPPGASLPASPICSSPVASSCLCRPTLGCPNTRLAPSGWAGVSSPLVCRRAPLRGSLQRCAAWVLRSCTRRTCRSSSASTCASTSGGARTPPSGSSAREGGGAAEGAAVCTGCDGSPAGAREVAV